MPDRIPIDAAIARAGINRVTKLVKHPVGYTAVLEKLKAQTIEFSNPLPQKVVFLAFLYWRRTIGEKGKVI